MRVVIATDSIGLLSSAEAGAAMAGGWAGAGTRVIPMGETGAGLAAAVGATLRSEPRLVAADGAMGVVVDAPGTVLVGIGSDLSRPSAPDEMPGIDLTASSATLGRLVAEALVDPRAGQGAGQGADSPAAGPELVVDLSGNPAHDAGAGFLAALGGDGPADLATARATLRGRRLIGVVPSDQLDVPLLGLRGITARAGRESGMDPELMLRTDAALERFAVGLDPAAARRNGAGAVGGLGFAVLALGGELTTGPAYCARIGGLGEQLARADLALTGCRSYDFAHRGGGVLAEVARQAAAALLPCVVLAGEVLIGAREMRTMGVEAAYAIAEPGPPDRAVSPTADPTADTLRALATRVARQWSW